jgi:hypothetical protein
LRFDPSPSRWALSLLATLSLIACGGGGGGSDPEDEGHDHEHTHISTAGRLALSENGSARLHVFELDSGAVEATHLLDSPASAVYSSPGQRYAVVLQNAAGLVQYVDGGLWQEDHGDHDHDYRQPSSLRPWKLAGARPSHFNAEAGQQAAVFFDGLAPANASFQLITDASIASGAVVAGTSLGRALHGLAIPRGTSVLAAHPDAGSGLPTQLGVYARNGTSYSFSGTLPTLCDGMHGGAAAGDYTAVGCNDGVLLVRQAGAVHTDAKLPTPSRVSTVASHPALPGQFIGFGNSGTPSTTRFHAVDGAAGTATEIVPQAWPAGTLRRAHGFDRSGRRFFVLDSTGALHAWTHGPTGWTTAAPVAGVIPAMGAAAPFPAMAASAAVDEIYLTDPGAQQLVTLDSRTLAVKSRRALGFVPAHAAWVGIAR